MNDNLQPRSCPQSLTPRSFILLSCLAFSVAGCDAAVESHEDGHLEHFVPAHKPNDFEDLVQQLERRASRLAQDGQPTGWTDEERTQAFQEFADIIGWIPERAADSELLRTDFESAVAIGSKLNAAFQKSREREKAGSVEMTAIEQLIGELRPLVPRSQPQKEPL